MFGKHSKKSITFSRVLPTSRVFLSENRDMVNVFYCLIIIIIIIIIIILYWSEAVRSQLGVSMLHSLLQLRPALRFVYEMSFMAFYKITFSEG